MLGKESRKCSLCRQTKPARDFPKTPRGENLLPKNLLCLLCKKNILKNKEDDDDTGGSGGNQQTRNSKQIQRDIELEAIFQDNLDNLHKKKQDKNMREALKTLESEQKMQTLQRELIDEKEEAKLDQQNDKPENLEYAQNTQVKRERITRLFSINAAKERNRRAFLIKQKNASVTPQSFGIFSQQTTKENSAAKEPANKKPTLSNESSAMFSQHHTAKPSNSSDTAKLEKVIREAQNLFKR